MEKQTSTKNRLETPVLFMIFNRIDTAEQVFAKIREVQPTKLYIEADGPRKHVPGELDACQQVRNKILSMIDWKCDLHTLFHEQNLGCKEAVSSAISWLFENEEQGIILEDDCLPETSFFFYCQKMLHKYSKDEEVMMISGTNYIAKQTEDSNNVFFSQYYAIWGWATWKRAWAKYDKTMSTWPAYKKSGALQRTYPYFGVAPQLAFVFESAAQGKVNTWDYQWFYTCTSNNGYTIVPSKNQISNLQFNSGTHNDGATSKYTFMKTLPLDVEKLEIPHSIAVDRKQEIFLFKEVGLSSPTYWTTLLIKKLRAVKKSLLKKK